MRRARGRRFRLAAMAVGAGAATGVGVFAPASASAASNTLTVDNTVSCSTSAGSAVYCTIVAGVKNAKAGDTVVVNPGTYAGGSSVKASGVTVRANGAVTVNGGAHGFTVDGFSDVTIQGFTVTNTTGAAFDLGDRSSGATATTHLTTNNLHIVNNTVIGAGGAPAGPGVTGTSVALGISAYYVTNSVFSGNRLDRNNSHGLYLAPGSNGNTLSGNEASGNYNPNQRAANGLGVVGTGNTVIGNWLHDNQDSGLQFSTGGDRNTAVNNVAWHNGDHGIDSLNVTGGVLVNNTVVDNCDAGINVEGTSSGYTVENNVAVDNGTDTTCTHGPVGVGVNADGHPGQPGQVRIADSAIGDTTTVADYNLVDTVSPGVLIAPFDSRGLGAHDIVADPGFANAAGADFHISAASPAVGVATTSAPYAPASDADGKVRPSPASVGAYEGGTVPLTP